MPITSRVDDRNHVVHVEYTGEVNLDDGRELFDQLEQNPAQINGFSFVCDISNADPLTTAFVHGLAELVALRGEPLDIVRHAIVAPQNVQFVMSRMFALLAEKSGVETRPFRRSEEAKKWSGLPQSWPDS